MQLGTEFQAWFVLGDQIGQTFMEGVCEDSMSDHTVAKEGGRTQTASTIDQLVGKDEVAGWDLFTEWTDGGEGNDNFNPKPLKGSNVGSNRYFGGR